MPESPKLSGQTAGLRKRQQIAGANKMMFIWVAGASIVVGAALVAVVFLGQKLIFTQKVLSAKQDTASTLSDNLKNVSTLKDNVRVLNTNPSLKSVMTPNETDPIQAVLDALPSEANSTALGASLQQSFLSKPGIDVQALAVTPVSGIESSSNSGSGDSTDAATGSNTITFSFTAKINDGNTVDKLLKDFERSVRTIDITNLTINYTDGSFVVTANGVAYYEPSVTVKLKDETIKP